MVKINFSNRQRKVKLPSNARNLVTQSVEAVLSSEGFCKPCEVNVTFVSDDKISKINKAFRNIDKSTDVLSFPLGVDHEFEINPENNFLMLGDVIISLEHALAQAEYFGHGVDREIAYLTVHSILHLLGYDHIDEGEEKKLMRSKEEKALKILGLEIK